MKEIETTNIPEVSGGEVTTIMQPPDVKLPMLPITVPLEPTNPLIVPETPLP
jgi:hypothetical protein